MRVLSIGSDEHAFEEGSAVLLRQAAYAAQLGHVDLVVLSKHPHETRHGEPLSIFAAYANHPVARLLSARKIARQLPRPDVVTVQDPFEIGFIGWLVARHFGAALHVQVHTDFLAPGFLQHSFLNGVRVWLARFVLARCSRVRVVSNDIKENISPALTKAPVSVLPIFTDIEKIRTAPVDSALAAKFQRFATKLLVVARLEPEKNVSVAISAFAEVAPSDACLIIVGKGSELVQLERRAQELGISDQVFFEGEQPAINYYVIADLVLVPSRYEGYGLVIVEALAAGKPVLSSDVGVAREAGAIVSSRQTFSADLQTWLASGPRQGVLKNYPYGRFADYVSAYCDDLTACADSKKAQ